MHVEGPAGGVARDVRGGGGKGVTGRGEGGLPGKVGLGGGSGGVVADESLCGSPKSLQHTETTLLTPSTLATKYP